MIQPLVRFLDLAFVQGQCCPDAGYVFVGKSIFLTEEMNQCSLYAGVLGDQRGPLWSVALEVLDRGVNGGISAQG